MKDNIHHVVHDDSLSQRMDALLLQQQHYYSFFSDCIDDSKGEYHAPKSSFHIPSTCLSTDYESTPVVELAQYRDRLCKWLYSVIDYYTLERDLVAVILNILDRYYHHHHHHYPSTSCHMTQLLKGSSHDHAHHEEKKKSQIKSSIQLVTLTSLHIVVKANCKAKLRFKTLLSLAKNAFTQNQVLQMEITLMNTIQWRISVPTPKVFSQHYMTLLHSVISSYLEECGEKDDDYDELYFPFLLLDIQSKIEYLGELSVCNSYFHNERILPSIIAAASFILAMRLCELPRSILHETQLVLFQHMGIMNSVEKNLLLRCMSRLCWMYTHVTCEENHDEKEYMMDDISSSQLQREPSPTHAQDYPLVKDNL